MSDSPDDLADKARSIFERLRATAEAGDEDGDAIDAPDEEAPPAAGSEGPEQDPAPFDVYGDQAHPPVAPEQDTDDTAGTAGTEGEDGWEPTGSAMADDTAAAPASVEPAPATPVPPVAPDRGEPADAAEDEVAGGAADGSVAASAPLLRSPLPTDLDAAPDLTADPPATDPAAPPGEATSPFAADLPRVVAIANQKGGVGKTTTAVNLSACLAELGYRVLVVDLDPQGNATTGLGINPRNLQVSMYDVLLQDRPLDDCIEPTSVRGLFVAPSSLDLAGAEIELVPVFSRELKLRRAVEAVAGDFDFVLIDCPPSLGLLTVNGLAAATEVLVPIQCEYYALEGLGQLLRNVSMVQKNLNPQLELRAIVLVMYDARTKLSGEVVAEVRSHFGDKVCRNVVPRTVRLSEAPSFGQPIVAFDPSSRGAIAYRELAREFAGGAPQMASPAT